MVDKQKQAPIVPTLVICLGKYGYEVGVQLAARLLLMEAALHQDGLIGPLIGRVIDQGSQKGKIVPGLIRIMHIDWSAWLCNSYSRNSFLTDIKELTDAAVAEKGTPPCVIDVARHPSDIQNARIELNFMRDQLVAACLPLREHDTNPRKGYPSQSAKVNFHLRIVVVCAAREEDSAAFTCPLIKLLSDVYVRDEQVTGGIQLLCSVGGTLLVEHISAGGTEGEYRRKNHQLPRLEQKRILAQAKTDGTSGLLEQITQLWSTPPALEICYLIDGRLENRLVPTRGRVDEPDGVIIVAALILYTLIATDSDQIIRNATSSRLGLKNLQSAPGPFAAVGIASYAIDHPKIHRLVHNWLISDFLLRAQPPMKGDRRMAGNPEELVELSVEVEVEKDLLTLLEEYKEATQFVPVSEHADLVVGSSSSINMEQVVSSIVKCDANARSDIKKQFTHLTIDFKSISLEDRLQKRQKAYCAQLRQETSRCNEVLYRKKLAPLTLSYRFLRKISEEYIQRITLFAIPLNIQNAPAEQRLFAEHLQDSYDQAEGESVDIIQRELRRRPTEINTFGHALLVTTTLILLFKSAFSIGLTLFSILIAAILFLSTWLILYRLHIQLFRRVIQRELDELIQLQQSLLQAISAKSWEWALAEYADELTSDMGMIEPLCRPKGIVAALRDNLKSQDTPIEEHTLERLFLTEQLKQALYGFIQQSGELKRMWQLRTHLLPILLSGKITSIAELEQLLRTEAEMVYKSSNTTITDFIADYIEQKSSLRLGDIYHTLSDTAVPFLQYATTLQEDPTTDIELFGFNKPEKNESINALTQQSQVCVVDSVDTLHWIFMRTHTGLQFKDINLSIKSLLPF